MKGRENAVGAEALRSKLRHVYWIGGGSGAGKSTTARRLAARHRLRLYSTDDVMPEHGHRITGEEAPFLRDFVAMSMDERRVNRSPETMLGTFHWFRGEGFGLIAEDLLGLAEEGGVVAEGFRLLPRLVLPYLAVTGHAVWLLPTPAFRRAAFGSRGTLWEIPRRTSDPDRARRNLLVGGPGTMHQPGSAGILSRWKPSQCRMQGTSTAGTPTWQYRRS